jgi:mannose-6-phosphate isomerase-like protein (cupin superfamily)
MISGDSGAMTVVNRQRAAIINTPHGSEIRPLIDRTTSNVERCSLAEEVLPVGASVGRHHHVETEEIYYILRGSGRMMVGSEVREVESGDAVFIPRGYTHTLENTGHEPMTLLLVCGPAYSYEDHHAGDAPSREEIK